MSSRVRALEAGAVYHVTARGASRIAIFAEHADRVCFGQILGVIARARGWRVHAYCLMPNHYHLVIETPEPDLSAGMHDLNGRFATAYNRRHERPDHVFGARFYATRLTRDTHMKELFRYLALNPVRAGLCGDPAAWRWSSYAPLAGLSPSPLPLDIVRALSWFGPDPDRARRRMARFVYDGLGIDPPPLPEAPDIDTLVPPERPAIHTLLATLPEPEAFRTAYFDHGYTMREIAAAAGISRITVSRRLTP